MDGKPIVPKFDSEADEARWWFENQDMLTEQFLDAAAQGRLGRGTLAKRLGTPATTIPLDTEDVSKARALAEKRGLQYQTYLKMLIHEALLREEKLVGEAAS